MNKNAVVTTALCLVIFAVGFGLGRMTQGNPVDFVQGTQTGDVQQNSTAGTGAQEQAGETAVNANNLTEGQKSMIRAMGLDPDNITITAEMVACAEAKLGSARVEEIKNGATPSFTEGASLVACYR